MIKHIEYGDQWSDSFCKWIECFDEGEARRRHAARTLYSMLIDLDDGSRLVLIMAFAGAWCFVNFLDEQDRFVLKYCFDPTEDGRLFLSQITEHRYEGDDRNVQSGIHTMFEPDGQAREISGTRNGPRWVREYRTTLDPRVHYEPVPEFGRWDSLIRRDRTRPPR